MSILLIVIVGERSKLGIQEEDRMRGERTKERKEKKKEEMRRITEVTLAWSHANL